MQSRETRFWLRFESGARQGEKVLLAAGVTSLGRRPENTIVVNDGSVSGRHAELRVGEEGVELVDLGSTNGTKHKGLKITSVSLAPGDAFLLGAVRLVFGATEPEAGSAESDEGGGIELEGLEAPATPAAPAADVVESVGAEQVARARKRSRSAPLLLVLLLAAAGFAAWRFWPHRAGPGASARVAEVSGNRLANGTLEGGADEGFASVDAAPQGFHVESIYAHTGRLGIGTTLAAGEWALARSAPFELAPDRRVDLAASVSAEAGTLARLGIELSRSDGRPGTVLLWGEPLSGAGTFAPAELPFTSWTGYDRGRLYLAASAESAGVVAFDDLSVVPAVEPLASAAVHDEFAAMRIGAALMIVRSGQLFCGPIEFGRWGDGGPEGFARASFTVEESPKGFALHAGPTPAQAWIGISGPRAAGGAAVRVATLGPDGYQSHASEFVRAGATAVLFGEGLDLLELTFARPLTVRGTTRDGAPWIAAEVGADGSLGVQLSFREERAEATLLESRARAAESSGDYGAAIAAWTELLDRVPFEARLVDAATAERARRLQSGLEALAGLRAEFERGRFFELAELYREVRARAQALCRAYAATEVERGGRDLIEEIERALAASGESEALEHARRVSAVLGALDAAKFPLLRRAAEAELALTEAAGE
jgi:hypothetical protein